jgi:hypothetical protein
MDGTNTRNTRDEISHSKTFNNLQYMSCEMLASSLEGTKFNKSLNKCNAPLVRLETNRMLKCIKTKQLCEDDHVKFRKSKAIWMVNDCEKWFLVTVFTNYGCSCVDSPSCCHV